MGVGSGLSTTSRTIRNQCFYTPYLLVNFSDLFYFMCVSIFLVCMFVNHMHALHSWCLEDGIHYQWL